MGHLYYGAGYSVANLIVCYIRFALLGVVNAWLQRDRLIWTNNIMHAYYGYPIRRVLKLLEIKLCMQIWYSRQT